MSSNTTNICIQLITQNANTERQNIFLCHFNDGDCVHVFTPFTNILYETPGNAGLDSLADEEFGILIPVDVLKFKAI